MHLRRVSKRSFRNFLRTTRLEEIARRSSSYTAMPKSQPCDSMLYIDDIVFPDAKSDSLVTRMTRL
jgi:hypothetical protein